MICSLSGQPAQEPVATKNGDIYEKRLIVKHIEAHGLDPITNEALSAEDLVVLRVSNANGVKPRQVSQSSIPGLLQTFQNEWDALMLETFTLKKQLETTREELSHALYQSDASCRVIARLIKERDSSRKELEQLRQAVGRGGKMEVEGGLPGLDAEAKSIIASKGQELTRQRKDRQPSPALATVEELKQWKQLSSNPPHKASSPGVLCVDVHPHKQELTLTGGVDKTGVVFNRKTGKKEATLVGHSKKVTSALFHPTAEVYITGSSDNTVKVWGRDGAAAHTIAIHNDEVVELSLHPTANYVVSASKDRTWGFHHVETGKSLLQVTEPDESPLTCIMMHPDGFILATGTEDNLVRIWDLRTQKNVATFRGHKDQISALRFSENGYYLSTASHDNFIKLWDLRGPKNVQSLKLESRVVSLDYDYSGKYLAAATGSEIRIFTGKAFDHVTTLDGHTEIVTGVKFGNDAKFLASSSMDRTLKTWGI